MASKPRSPEFDMTEIDDVFINMFSTGWSEMRVSKLRNQQLIKFSMIPVFEFTLRLGI